MNNCDCLNDMRDDYIDCPFYLECLDDAGYVTYCQLVRDHSGKVTGYMNVLMRCKS